MWGCFTKPRCYQVLSLCCRYNTPTPPCPLLLFASQETANRSSPCKRTHEQMTGSPGKAASKTVACRLKELQAQGLERPRQGAVFWPYSWRSELCTCTSCKVGHCSQPSGCYAGLQQRRPENFSQMFTPPG